MGKSSKDAQKWRACFLLSLFFIRVGTACFASLLGPTLLYLAENVDRPVSSVSYIFTGRALGMFLGAILCSFFIRKFDNFRPLLSTAISVVISGALITAIPWITNLTGLILSASFTGISYGYLDSGAMNLYLKLWGSEGSRSLLQGHHFASGFGAMLAPIIAAPFLEMVESTETSSDSSCPNFNQSTDDIETTTQGSFNNNVALNPITWPYVISGGVSVVSGLVLVYLALINIESKMTIDDKLSVSEKVTQKEEEPLKDVWLLFVAVIFYYFAVASISGVFQNYIYSIALCSRLAFTAESAAWLNTLFWIGMVVGRAYGVVAAPFFHPQTLIIYGLSGTIMAMTLFAIFGETISLTVWFVTIFQGLCFSTLYSSGISWTSQITNISATYVFIFSLGNGAGNMSMPPVAGVLLEDNPFSVVYLLLGLSGFSILVFVAMVVIGRRHVTPLQLSTNYSTRL